LNLVDNARTSHTFVVLLKTIREYIAHDMSSAHSMEELCTHSTASQNAFQNLDSNSSFENHHVNNLLNNVIGFSQVRTWLQNITHAVIHAFPQNDIFLLVKNLYNQ
jgi:uncharacterized membrane protein